MNKLMLKIPPAVLLLATASAMIAMRELFPILIFDVSISHFFAWVLYALGILVCFLAFIAFRHHETTVDPRHPRNTKTLVMIGVFQYSRNPMYLSFVLILLGLSLHLGALSCLLLVPLFIAYVASFQIKPEELVLEELFGDQYLDYKASVGRWL